MMGLLTFVLFLFSQGVRRPAPWMTICLSHKADEMGVLAASRASIRRPFFQAKLDFFSAPERVSRRRTAAAVRTPSTHASCEARW